MRNTSWQHVSRGVKNLVMKLLLLLLVRVFYDGTARREQGLSKFLVAGSVVCPLRVSIGKSEFSSISHVVYREGLRLRCMVGNEGACRY